MFQPPDVLRKGRYNGCGFVQVELDSLHVSKALSEMLFSVKRGIWNLPICKLSRKKNPTKAQYLHPTTWEITDSEKSPQKGKITPHRRDFPAFITTKFV